MANLKNLNVSVYVINEHELMFRKAAKNYSVEYIIAADAGNGVLYLLDGESRNILMTSEDFGLAEKGVPRDTRISALCTIIKYLLLRAKITVNEDSPNLNEIKKFCDILADHMI